VSGVQDATIVHFEHLLGKRTGSRGNGFVTNRLRNQNLQDLKIELAAKLLNE
jgi:hypothetical protein